MDEGCGITQEEIDQNIAAMGTDLIGGAAYGNAEGSKPSSPHSSWQPIESAPRDGTRFLAGHYRVRISQPNYFEWYVCVYAGECKIPTDDEEWGVEGNDGEFYCPEGFYREAQDKYGDEQYMVAKPTHWMPVPPINDNNLRRSL